MSTIANNSFFLFLFPFRFDGSAYPDLIAQVNDLRASTKQRESRASLQHELAEDDLLPHVTRYLNEVTEMDNYLQMKRTAHLQVLAEAQKRGRNTTSAYGRARGRRSPRPPT